jgi:hypothetical protein
MNHGTTTVIPALRPSRWSEAIVVRIEKLSKLSAIEVAKPR